MDDAKIISQYLHIMNFIQGITEKKLNYNKNSNCPAAAFVVQMPPCDRIDRVTVSNETQRCERKVWKDQN